MKAGGHHPNSRSSIARMEPYTDCVQSEWGVENHVEAKSLVPVEASSLVPYLASCCRKLGRRLRPAESEFNL